MTTSVMPDLIRHPFSDGDGLTPTWIPGQARNDSP